MKHNHTFLVVLFTVLQLSFAAGDDKPLGKILAINPQWGFALVNVGQEDGIAPGARLIIQSKDGKNHAFPILKLEPRKAVIDLGSVDTIRIDDPVISQEKPQQEAQHP